jgi:predicted ATPase with chaperone activity
LREIRPAEIRQFCPLDETSTNLVKTAMQQIHLSARAYHRILKLACTIADLARENDIQSLSENPRSADFSPLQMRQAKACTPVFG